MHISSGCSLRLFKCATYSLAQRLGWRPGRAGLPPPLVAVGGGAHVWVKCRWRWPATVTATGRTVSLQSAAGGGGYLRRLTAEPVWHGAGRRCRVEARAGPGDRGRAGGTERRQQASRCMIEPLLYRRSSCTGDSRSTVELYWRRPVNSRAVLETTGQQSSCTGDERSTVEVYWRRPVNSRAVLETTGQQSS